MSSTVFTVIMSDASSASEARVSADVGQRVWQIEQEEPGCLIFTQFPTSLGGQTVPWDLIRPDSVLHDSPTERQHP